MPVTIGVPKWRHMLLLPLLAGLLGCQSTPPMTRDADMAARVAESSGHRCADSVADVLAAEGHAASDLVSVNITSMESPRNSGSSFWGYLASVRLTDDRSARVYMSPGCRPTGYAAR